MASTFKHAKVLQLALVSGLGIGALDGLMTSQVKSQVCTPDPLGAEVCQPPTSNKITQPGPDPEDPETVVVTPPCFGPCTQFPPAPPYRQFEQIVETQAAPEPTPIPEPEPTPEPIPAEPIRPLWFKSDALDPLVAETYLEQTLQKFDLAQLSDAEREAYADDLIVSFNGVRYLEIVEPHGLLYTNEVNEPKVNVWVRGFGGSSSNGSTGHRNAHFDNGGAQLGFDIPLSKQTRIGLFGTYAVMNGSDGSRGDWDADGWGGGAYAEYWSRAFVMRGMVSAGGYDGEHRRSVDSGTAKGDRSGNSWTGVLSVAAPIESGDWLIEPQGLISYTNTSLDRFSEHGADQRDRLRFDDINVDQVGTELTLKFAHPIRDGERSLFLPSLRVGWAADWGLSGDDQKVTFLHSGQTKHWNLNSSDHHAALIELGLDYTTFNFNDTSMGVYARGGTLIWGGDRGTTWQVQGGLSFRF